MLLICRFHQLAQLHPCGLGCLAFVQKPLDRPHAVANDVAHTIECLASIRALHW